MRLSLILSAAVSGLAPLTPVWADAEKPAALVADGIPPVPDEIVVETRPYMESRSAGFSGWNTADKSMLISTRFANTSQLHVVKAPMAARTQISFEAEPVGGSMSPTGDTLIVTKDTGGNEFFQLYTLKDGKLTLLTDGKSRNGFNGWSKDGELIAFTSTKRDGANNDIYVMDPRDPASAKMIKQVDGGGWSFLDFAPDKKSAVIGEYISVTKSNLYRLDLVTGETTPITDPKVDVAWGGGQFAPDGGFWITSDVDSDFQRLGTLDLTTGKFTPRNPEKKWDVDSFDISEDCWHHRLCRQRSGHR